MGRLWQFLVVIGALGSPAFAYEECGPLANAYGPFDYRTEQDKIAVVEQYHFTPGVETLKRGATGVIGADLDYTLRASPNHHRALIAMVKWGEKLKTERPPGTNYTIRCYIDRALRFRPDDAMPRLIQANYLSKHGQKAEALKQLEAAKETAGESATVNMLYNLGLAYFELGEFDKALANAHRAYQLGFGLPGLRTKLQKAGKWRDPEPVKPSTDTATQAPSDVIDSTGKTSPEPAQPQAQPQ
ncbi:hypothetical protein GCM10027296_45500 [Chitinimonas naiadis]